MKGAMFLQEQHFANTLTQTQTHAHHQHNTNESAMPNVKSSGDKHTPKPINVRLKETKTTKINICWPCWRLILYFVSARSLSSAFHFHFIRKKEKKTQLTDYHWLLVLCCVPSARTLKTLLQKIISRLT